MTHTHTQSQSNLFYSLVDLPDFLVSWVDRFYQNQEIELVLLLGPDTLDTEAVRQRWSGKSDDTCPRDMDVLLERAFKRGVLHRDDRNHYAVADFHTRYDIWALFEGWQDIPEDIRNTLNQWELSDYISQHRNLVEDLKNGNQRDTLKRWPEYLLLNEAEALMEAVEHIYLWPCNCRLMLGNCRKPVYTCLRFSNNRGIGWEISKSRAIEILREANRKGLMQSGEISVLPDGSISGALCNCCADCCFPHLLTKPLQAEKLWPLTRYVASVDKNRCTACGRCVRRCPFDAIALDKPGKALPGTSANDTHQTPAIHFDAGLCRGCGVCSTGCRDEAISMIKLEDVDSLFDTISI